MPSKALEGEPKNPWLLSFAGGVLDTKMVNLNQLHVMRWNDDPRFRSAVLGSEK